MSINQSAARLPPHTAPLAAAAGTSREWTNCEAAVGRRHRVQPPAVALLPLDVVAAGQPSAQLPEEADHVAFAPSLLAVEPELLKLLPVVELLQGGAPDPADEAALHRLEAVDAGL